MTKQLMLLHVTKVGLYLPSLQSKRRRKSCRIYAPRIYLDVLIWFPVWQVEKKYVFYRRYTAESSWCPNNINKKLQQGIKGSVYIGENLMYSTPLFTQIHLLDCWTGGLAWQQLILTNICTYNIKLILSVKTPFENWRGGVLRMVREKRTHLEENIKRGIL